MGLEPHTRPGLGVWDGPGQGRPARDTCLFLMLTPHQESQLGSGGEKLIGFGAKTETQSSGGCGNDGEKV